MGQITFSPPLMGVHSLGSLGRRHGPLSSLGWDVLKPVDFSRYSMLEGFQASKNLNSTKFLLCGYGTCS
jgi:hypothetical protein